MSPKVAAPCIACMCIVASAIAHSNPPRNECVVVHVADRSIDAAGNVVARVVVRNTTPSVVYVHKDLLPIYARYVERTAAENTMPSFSLGVRGLAPDIVMNHLMSIGAGSSIEATLRIEAREGYVLEHAYLKLLYGREPSDFRLEHRKRLKSAGVTDVWGKDQ